MTTRVLWGCGLRNLLLYLSWSRGRENRKCKSGLQSLMDWTNVTTEMGVVVRAVPMGPIWRQDALLQGALVQLSRVPFHPDTQYLRTGVALLLVDDISGGIS
ncbi:hypothetical protein P691DRAFT_800286 [Macrolepiota fuliginosa MF-IS2]|uniref:Uncharacterized protein n=1 Tax=Macrolepiota fuliginosa MF-IS2 TaxID=1400762 RepID=A0A9P5XGG5_9AGAR|nr:hypothetical protein P691DRAFT_800286 [Macrolepiota fuliginosa MF-IS2]